MRTVYSIVYVTLNTTLNERISIGLLMSNGEQHSFKYSAEKLIAVKGLLDTGKYHLTKNYLSSLEDDINLDNSLFGNQFNKNWVDENYITYLSKYSTNLIQFSKPKTIDIEFNHENFKRIFEKYIYLFGKVKEIITENNVIQRVKNQLYPKINTRVNLDKSLDASHFENLYAPIEINFIGVNEVPVAGQAIDFEKRQYNLENDLTRYISLTKAIELQEKKTGKYFILGKEPLKTNKNHVIWEQIRESGFLEFVDVNDADKVEDYIESHNVKPFFEE